MKKLVPKSRPDYIGVDAAAKPYVDEFFALSKRNNITFKHEVSVGFTKIDHGSVIGVCTYSRQFREVDLDKNFFDKASEKRKKALIFHELTHCYCARSHDFAAGQEYPDGIFDIFIEKIKNGVVDKIPWCLAKTPPGYLEDLCPSSIMHPYILEDTCLEQHWEYYIKEMFERCDPY